MQCLTEFDSKMDEVQLNLVQQCLTGEKFRPTIEKVRYLVLVQGSGWVILLYVTVRLIAFSAVDLTDSVQRLKKDHQSTGGFANVHRCKLRVKDIDASVQQLGSRYQFSSMTSCNDVGAFQLIVIYNLYINLGRSQGNKIQWESGRVEDHQCKWLACFVLWPHFADVGPSAIVPRD